MPRVPFLYSHLGKELDKQLEKVCDLKAGEGGEVSHYLTQCCAEKQRQSQTP